MRKDLFIGITSWNSKLFLPHCLQSIRATTADVATEIIVLDNYSDDGSANIARDFGATVLQERCSQADALNRLAAFSDAAYTLLIHPDVILLDPNWFTICCEKLSGSVVLISPEDIGCGPLTRPFGIGKPESSFMLFKTSALHLLRATRWRRRWKVPLPKRAIDFYGDHITHNLPDRLEKLDLNWFPMAVHWSDRVADAIFKPVDGAEAWFEELSFLRYGLGNFYSIDSTVTHYHNWYDRALDGTSSSLGADRKDRFPLGYIRSYTLAFLRDLETGRLVVPTPSVSTRKPMSL